MIGCVAPDDPTDPTTTIDSEEREAPSPGAPGLGDVLYPTLGNGGYKVEHYDLDLRYATAAPTQQLDGSVVILARATQALSSFDLDFHGDGFGAVTVDGRTAATSWNGDEMVITPAHPIRRGDWFVVRVAHFTSTPVVPDPNVFLGAPFFAAPDNSAWAGQSAFAHYIFPSNDHPSDKASFSFRLDVPEGTTAVANGVLLDQRTAHGRTVARYLQPEPMATELAQVAVGALTVIDRGVHSGVHVRDVVPTRLAADLTDKLAIETEQIAALEQLLGDYPFRTYGTLVVDTQLGFALETQTLSLFENGFFAEPVEVYGPIMAHELAHQWFGNSVAPAVWSDVWLNEGHASFYEHTLGQDLDNPALIEQVRQIYALQNQFRAFFGPPGQPRSGAPQDVFNPNVYIGGALTLFALREQVGDPMFRAIEREWVRRYRGRSASSADFIALSSELSGQDLGAFFAAWLYADTAPAMPNHPDWTVDPVPTGFAARLALPALPKFSVMVGTKR